MTTTCVPRVKPEHRDAGVTSGMASGVQVAMNRIEDLPIQLEQAAWASLGAVLLKTTATKTPY